MLVSALPDPTCNSERSANGGNKQILLLLLILLLFWERYLPTSFSSRVFHQNVLSEIRQMQKVLEEKLSPN